jgi:hypothetical protein
MHGLYYKTVEKTAVRRRVSWSQKSEMERSTCSTSRSGFFEILQCAIMISDGDQNLFAETVSDASIFVAVGTEPPLAIYFCVPSHP